MFLSIIIPVYNVEKYIARCLQSIISQNNFDFKFEILLINDGSTDKSLSIIKEYESQYSYIKVIDQKNCGAGSARNNGLQHAIGTHVWFIDSDDFIENDSFQVINERQKYLENNGTIGFNYYKYFNDSLKQSIVFDASEDDGRKYHGLAYTFDQKPFYLWNMIYDLSIIKNDNISFIEGIKNIEDFEFNLKYFDKCNDVYFFNNRIYNYCDNAESTTRNLTESNLIKIAEDSEVVHKEILLNLRNGIYINDGYIKIWLGFSVSGFMYSLFNLDYSNQFAKEYFNKYRNLNLLPIKNNSFYSKKMNLFNYFLNNKIIYFIIMSLKK